MWLPEKNIISYWFICEIANATILFMFVLERVKTTFLYILI